MADAAGRTRIATALSAVVPSARVLTPLPPTPKPDLSGSRRVDDAALREACRASSLESLALSNTEVGNGGLAHLGSLARLQALDLGCRFELDDAGLASLAGEGRDWGLGLGMGLGCVAWREQRAVWPQAAAGALRCRGTPPISHKRGLAPVPSLQPAARCARWLLAASTCPASRHAASAQAWSG